VASYEVTLLDKTTEVVNDVDSYTLEGPLTTFFATEGCGALDAWATRVVSLRTSEIIMVRRVPS